jgi:hypothetical protein
MKKLRNKVATIALVLFLTFSIGASIILSPASAHTPPWEIITYAYMSVAPNPVGVNQQVIVVMWLDKTIDGARLDNDIRFHNFNLTIIDPDGHVSTEIFPTVEDTTSSLYTSYTPEKVGNYTFIFSFPGQVHTYTNLIPPLFGGSPAQSAYVNDTYLASSTSKTLTVQEEPIPNPPTYPLPTEYWTHPIEGQNWNWYEISSNWLGSPGGTTFTSFACIQPDGTAPNSPHIMWTSPFLFGGVVGGNSSGHPGETYYTGLSYELQYTNAIIINGRLYYPLPLSNNPSGGGFVSVDLRTGQQYWKTTFARNPTFGQLVAFDSGNQHGIIPNGYLISTTQSIQSYSFLTSNLIFTSAGSWTFYDPLTGSMLYNITNVPTGVRDTGPSGEYLIYQLNAAQGWLALWNSSKAVANSAYLAGGTGAMLGNGTWRPVNLNINGNLGWEWNITVSSDINIAGSSIKELAYGKAILGGGSIPGGIGGTVAPTYTMWGLNLDPARGDIGKLLWIKTYNSPPGNVTHNKGPTDFETGVFTFSDKQTMVWYGYDLYTGEPLWGPTAQNHNDFDYYGNEGGNNINGYVAYGNLYTAGYGGIIFCYDLRTGNQLWTYGNGGPGNSTNSGLNSVYGNWPLFINAIADGKIYAFTNEHSPGAPADSGALQRCINATTGEEIWTLSSWDSSNAFIADGFLNYLNTYDMQIYTIGKGPSALTVDTPKVSIDLGKSLIISGTVIDLAAGTKQNEQAARFPNGVPAVSDASMKEWMEYVYMQKPKPTNATGVVVKLYVLDANNNYRPIGETTSDDNGFYSYEWEPNIAGKYTVYARFDGSESYWPSQAVSAFAVSDTGPTSQPPPESKSSVADQYFIPAIAGLFVAIIVVGALLAILLLKKRP